VNDNPKGEQEIEQSLRNEHSPKRPVRKRVDLLKKHGLVDTSGRRYRRVWRTPRDDYRAAETRLYPAMVREIEERWARQPSHNYYPEPRRFRHILTNVSGSQGAWRRPDITLVGGMTLPFLPGKFLDVVTFEVKLWSNRGQRLPAMYEALAHRRRATHSYVIYFRPSSQVAEVGEEAAITREALRTGVGVIVAEQEDDFATWKELVEPVRHSPDPHHLHEFLLSLAKSEPHFRRRLRNWITAEPFLESETKTKLSRIEEELGLESAEATDFFQEIPPATDREGLGFKGARPTLESVAGLLKMDTALATQIKEALEAAKLIRTVQRGGLERK